MYTNISICGRFIISPSHASNVNHVWESQRLHCSSTTSNHQVEQRSGSRGASLHLLVTSRQNTLKCVRRVQHGHRSWRMCHRVFICMPDEPCVHGGVCVPLSKSHVCVCVCVHSIKSYFPARVGQSHPVLLLLLLLESQCQSENRAMKERKSAAGEIQQLRPSRVLSSSPLFLSITTSS